jgi:hypothetical protein
MRLSMGWQDRDWAKWTDEERDRYLGRSMPVRGVGVGCADGTRTAVGAPRAAVGVAMLASLLFTAVAAQLHLFVFAPSPPPASPRSVAPAVVYGTSIALFRGSSGRMTCTAMELGAAGAACTAWTYLAPGQRAIQAIPLPPGPQCLAVQADQLTGHWVCTRSSVPAPASS